MTCLVNSLESWGENLAFLFSILVPLLWKQARFHSKVKVKMFYARNKGDNCQETVKVKMK